MPWKSQPIGSAQGWTLVNPLCPSLQAPYWALGLISQVSSVTVGTHSCSPERLPDQAGQFSYKYHSRFFSAATFFVVP